MLISIDFDGVIVKRTGIPRENNIFSEKPQEYALEAINYIMKLGHEVYIQSNRDADEIILWLKQNNFPLVDVTDKKKKGTAIYLDDRAIRFNGWQDFCKYLS